MVINLHSISGYNNFYFVLMYLQTCEKRLTVLKQTIIQKQNTCTKHLNMKIFMQGLHRCLMTKLSFKPL